MPLLYEIEFWNIEQEEIGQFHMLGDYFYQIADEVTYYLDELAGENNWEILKIVGMPQIAIINLEDYVIGSLEEENNHFKWFPENIECPSCALEHTVLDNILEFDCLCGAKYKLADNGWEKIICGNPECRNDILREDIIRDKISGKLVYGKKNKDIRDKDINQVRE